MVFKTNESKIVGLQEIRQLDEKSMMGIYSLEDGEKYVTIIPNEMSDAMLDRVDKTLDSLPNLLDMQLFYEKSFNGYAKNPICNSSSCREFYEKLLDALKILYQYNEFLRLCTYSDYVDSNYEKLDSESLQEIEEIEKSLSKILEINSSKISPIWRYQKNIFNITYQGANPEALFDGREMFAGNETWKKAWASDRVKYCLATGRTKILGANKYGGDLRKDFIESIYGEEVALMYKKEIEKKDNKKR